MAKKAAPVVVKPLTKSEIQSNIAEATGLTKKQVASVMDALVEQIRASVSGKGAGVFVLPGLLKIEKKSVPAKKAQKHVENPFKKGEFRDIPAKPASSKIKIRPLKGLKDSCEK